MKKITIFIFIVSLTLSKAINAEDGISHSKFQVQQMDPEVDVGSLKEVNGIQVLEIKDYRDTTTAKPLPSGELTYQIVRSVVDANLTQNWDQLDFDQFYMRLQSRKASELIKMYQGLTLKQIDKLKAEFKKYE